MPAEAISRFSEDDVVAFACAGSEWPRSALASTPIPDSWFALIAKPDGRRWIVPSGEDPRPERGDTLTLVRNRAIVVPIGVVDAESSDRRPVTVRAELLVRWPMREDALDAYRRGPFAENPLRLERLAAILTNHGGERALREFAASRLAAALTDGDLREALGDFLRHAMRAFLFENGLTLERVAALHCDCPSLRAERDRARAAGERIEQIKSRELVEKAALEAARRRVGELSGLFEKLRGAAGGDGGRWHELLPALAPHERVRLLENLWRIMPDRTSARYVVAVAGNDCGWLNPRLPGMIERRVALPATLGKLRSIAHHAESDSLLVGAADGVWMLGAAGGEVRAQFRVDRDGKAQTGFNAAAIQDDRVYATHSLHGLWSWPLNGGAGRADFAPSSGAPRRIRCCTSAPDGVYFAADDRVMRMRPGEAALTIATAGRGEIRSLAIAGEFVFFGTDEGMLLRDRLDGSQGVAEVCYRTDGPIESIQARRWSDMTELVFPGGSAGVLGLFVEEGIIGRLLDASGQFIRRAWVGDDLVVAMRDLRDRLILLRADDAGRAGQAVSMIDLLGRDMEDACVVVNGECKTQNAE
ncbi:MAG: hypothetical protein JNG88_11585 [Phycisphaerales bacterium]|nr:hypothetical protein [Phycisphaerales bacterium]